MDFNLNRYKNNIYEDTPYQVIIELVASCGKNIKEENITEHREKIVSFLENYNYVLPPEISYYSNDDYNKIANFVSGESSPWQRENLLRAKQHIIDFDEKLEISVPIRYGYKTNDNFFNYDIIMLYNYCYSRKIKLDKEDTIETIAEKIKVKKEEDAISEEDCVEIIKDNVEDCNKLELLQIMKFLHSKEKKEKEIIETPAPVVQPVPVIEVKKKRPLSSIEEIKNNININYMISRSDLDENEALVYAAKFLALNLKDSDNKVEELMEYNRCRVEEITYSPLFEDKFGKNYKINNYYYRLEYFWHPEISDLYPQKNINMLLKNEALKSEAGKDELDTSLCYKNFYLGIIPGQENQETLVYKSAPMDITRNKILTYGIRQENNFVLLSIEEIIKHFKSYGRLVDFVNTEEKINDHAIKKLISICKLFSSEEEYMSLLELIDEIKNKKPEENNLLEEFKGKYLFASDQIDRVFEEIFFLAMYIRGWKINNMYDYPLTADSCLSYSDYEKKIEDNVRSSIRRINNYTDNIADKSISKMIKQLPLIKYNRKNKEFYNSVNTEEGLTIFDRIKIINETSDNVYACLKLSSNHLAASAQYYLDKLAGKKIFDIDKLEFIQ